MESTSTLPAVRDLSLRRIASERRLRASRRALLAVMAELDCPDLRAAHAAVGNAVVSLDDAIEGVRS